MRSYHRTEWLSFIACNFLEYEMCIFPIQLPPVMAVKENFNWKTLYEVNRRVVQVMELKCCCLVPKFLRPIPARSCSATGDVIKHFKKWGCYVSDVLDQLHVEHYI